MSGLKDWKGSESTYLAKTQHIPPGPSGGPPCLLWSWSGPGPSSGPDGGPPCFLSPPPPGPEWDEKMWCYKVRNRIWDWRYNTIRVHLPSSPPPGPPPPEGGPPPPPPPPGAPLSLLKSAYSPTFLFLTRNFDAPRRLDDPFKTIVVDSYM